MVYSNTDVKVTRPGETVYGKGFEADTKLEKIVIKNRELSLRTISVLSLSSFFSIGIRSISSGKQK